jgi:hypothetical protein
VATECPNGSRSDRISSRSAEGPYAAPSDLLRFLVAHGFPRHTPSGGGHAPLIADGGPEINRQIIEPGAWAIGAALMAIGCTTAVITRLAAAISIKSPRDLTGAAEAIILPFS